MQSYSDNLNPVTAKDLGSDLDPSDSELALGALATGLMRLSDEERKQLETIITPEAAKLLAKAFGPNFWQLLAPLLRDDAPEDREKAEAELAQMMRDPRYWRDKDNAIIRKVTDGFRRLYPE